MITLADIEAARDRIAGGVYYSPCVESISLSQLTGAHIWCKLDYLQRTGSFKERGARNALLQLTPEQRRRGVIAASAGNAVPCGFDVGERDHGAQCPPGRPKGTDCPRGGQRTK